MRPSTWRTKRESLPKVRRLISDLDKAGYLNKRTSGLVPNIDPGVAITLLDQALNIQTTYGAVLLSFLGALHWGFEFAGYGGHKQYVCVRRER